MFQNTLPLKSGLRIPDDVHQEKELDLLYRAADSAGLKTTLPALLAITDVYQNKI